MVVYTSFIEPSSPIKFQHRNTRAVLDKRDLGLGTLYISERTLCWKEQLGTGLTIEYPNISLHAISSDTKLYPRECIYVMTDPRIHMPDEENEHKEDDDSDAESESEFSELILVPADPSALSPMYESLKECQALNPDPEDMDDEEDDVYEDADEDLEHAQAPVSHSGDIGGGGDTDINNLVDRMQSNSVQISYHYSNGDHVDEQQFDDVD